MSQENVELVRRAFQAFNDHDLDALLANYADDVEWRLIGGFADLMGTELKGRNALRRWFADWIENLGGRVELETVYETNDHVVVIVRTEGAGAASGAPASLRFGQVITVRDQQITAVDNYYQPDEALEAAGLNE